MHCAPTAPRLSAREPSAELVGDSSRRGAIHRARPSAPVAHPLRIAVLVTAVIFHLTHLPDIMQRAHLGLGVGEHVVLLLVAIGVAHVRGCVEAARPLVTTAVLYTVVRWGLGWVGGPLNALVELAHLAVLIAGRFLVLDLVGLGAPPPGSGGARPSGGGAQAPQASSGTTSR